MNFYYTTVDFKGIGNHRITVFADDAKALVGKYSEFRGWCEENCSGEYLVRQRGSDEIDIFFHEKTKAMEFKLVFG